MFPKRSRIALAALLAAALSSLSAGDLVSQDVRRGGTELWDMNVGPFVEYRSNLSYDDWYAFRHVDVASTNSVVRRLDETKVRRFMAVRPFYSSAVDDDSSTYDVLWPFYTSHSDRTRSWWRFMFFIYGASSDADAGYDADSSNWNVFPFWFCGTTRAGDDYWGLFPIYGKHPHVALMDDWQFVCWPVYHTYTVKGVRSHAVMWPFVTWRDDPRPGFGLWPLLGWNTQRESRHRYALWPFVTWTDYEADRDTSGAGSSWMVWPIAGCVLRERENQVMILPPFLSHVETPSVERTRCPWPFIEFEEGVRRDRTSLWPIYEHVKGYSYGKERKLEEVTHRWGWKLVEDSKLHSSVTDERRFSVFPFWTYERREATGKGRQGVTYSYKRAWPFWSKETIRGKSFTRVLDLVPIRNDEGVDRNWGAFWSFYESVDCDDGRNTRHWLLWRIFSWTSKRDD